ncbi:Hypothetical predicted protein [Cloeon dipterum]|uniref:UDP-glycosyltransferases domain-containing protein n=1 Tax=Cloeon dipterum TaxID=197152 RepID=A0A8S1BX74_9INSE|nr:Hypothetical predicted protein [Cloeon dipterum]
MRLCSLALILCAGLSAAHGSRILCLFGVSGKSHNNFFSSLTRELANRGHDLTVLTSYPTNKTSANYKEIAVDVMDKVGAVFSPFTHTEENFFSQFGSIIKIFVQTCPYVLQTPQVKPLLNEKFDLVFISMFFNQCFLPFGYLNGAPVIAISPGGSFGMGMDMENPEPTSYVPSVFLPFTSKMTFTERVANTVMTQLISALGTYYLKPHMHQAAKEFFGPNIPTIEEMEKNISLVIYNNHFSLNSPRPLNPGIIEAGGMHIKEKNEKLSKDLQDFMDGAKDGVIYFSMGSVVQGSQMPKDKLNALLEAFTELPQRVIFKWETDEMPDRPKNVKIGKWLPQQAILAHPNIRLFITHGGLLSTQEAAYHGVPLVGIPFFGDQQLNVAKSARMGFAVGLDFTTLSKQSVLQAIKTVVDNPSFLKNAQDLKRRVRDQQDKPLDRALFWTEYVLRHNGAPHLRTAATDMRWWQVHLIDVYGAIFTFIFAVLLFDYYLIKWCCCRSKNKPGKLGNSARILGLFPFSGPSHNHVFSALTTALHDRGHDLTVVTAYPLKNAPNIGYRQIDVKPIRDFFESFDVYEYSGQSTFGRLWSMWYSFSHNCPLAAEMPEVRQLLKEKFDLVLVSTFFNECLIPFAKHNKAPLVMVSSLGSLGFGMGINNPEPSSFVPSVFLPFTDHMSFSERMVNFFATLFVDLCKYFRHYPKMDAAAKALFGPDTPSVMELETDTSLIILNSHPSLSYPKPLLPNVIEAGGMHIREDNETLPEDLKQFMDDAEHGVIYFSMGSTLKGNKMPRSKVDILVSAFAELPQRVIWKWESESLPGKPDNVKISEWLPQQAILAHPNLKVFFTHGGLLSTQESAYFGVPLIGMPMLGDQMLNVERSEKLGYAVGIDFKTLTKESVMKAIRTVLDNESYKLNAEKLKTRFRDQPEMPLERAIYWTEFVLKHNGAPHLQSQAAKLSWYQLYMLDVWALLFILITFGLWTDYLFIKSLFKSPKKVKTS